MRDVIMAWLGAKSRREAWEKLDDVHEEYYAMVRREVPEQQLLEFQHDDGWQPLCEFLGVPVPDVPFPKTNMRGEFTEMRNVLLRRLAVRAVVRIGLCLFGLGAVGGLLWWQRAAAASL
jgi:hypothetical protein